MVSTHSRSSACRQLVAMVSATLALAAAGAARAQDRVGEDAAIVSAEEIDLEQLDDVSLTELLDVVVTATKTAESIYESPAIVTVLTRAEINAWGYRSLDEALRHVVGFYVIDDHMMPDLAVRGVAGGMRAESGVIKVMIDGSSVAFRATAGNWLGPELIPLSAVERIEIIRGPASALYGADAFLGVINIITRGGAELDGADVAVTGNAIHANPGGDLDLSVGSRNGPFELLLSTRLHTEDRSGLLLPETSPAPLVPTHREDDLAARGLRRSSGTGLLKLRYHFDPETWVSLTGYSATVDAGGEFADWLQLGNGVDHDGRFSENRLSLTQALMALRFETVLFERLDLSADARYFAGGVTPNDRVETGSDVFYVRRELGYRGVDLEATGRWRFDQRLSLLAGLSLLWDDEQKLSTLRVIKTGVGAYAAGQVDEAASQRQGRETFINPGATLQLVWKPFDQKLGLTGGLRYDYHNIYGSQLSGRLGLVTTPFARFHAKLLYGSAFKAPSPLQLYAVPYRAGDLIGNPALEPQRVHTIEGQVVHELHRAVVVSGGVAYNVLQDMVEFTPQGVNQSARNLAEVHSVSVESELLLRHEDWLAGYLNVAVNATRRVSGEEGYRAQAIGEEGLLFPPAIANAGLRYKIHHAPLRAGLELSGVSARRASAENILEHGACYRLPPYLLLGATLSTVGLHLFNARRETVISVGGRNLLDSAGPDPGFGGVDYPLTGRSFWLQLRQQI